MLNVKTRSIRQTDADAVSVSLASVTPYEQRFSADPAEINCPLWFS